MMMMNHPQTERPYFRKWTISDIRNGVLFCLVHLVCIMAPFQFTWAAFWVAFWLYIIIGLGITLSYHRNLAHRSFKLPKLLEYLFAYIGVQAIQGDPINWVSTHRFHHQFTDSAKDPHSPIEGFWYSHTTWFLNSYKLTNKIGRQYVEDFKEGETNIFMYHIIHGNPKNVGDLDKQIFYRFLRKTYYLHAIPLPILLYAMGGLPFLVWGMGVRIVFTDHITFFVNSICHIWGTQPWNTNDSSKNNWLVGVLAHGEGWHNNHHAFEYSARHGLKWWQFDLTWYVIRILQAIGIATNVKLPSQKHMQRLAIK